MLNPSPMEAAILDDSGPVRSRHLGDDSGQVWFKLAQQFLRRTDDDDRRQVMAILAHEGAHKTFGFSTLKIWLKEVINAFLVTIT